MMLLAVLSLGVCFAFAACTGGDGDGGGSGGGGGGSNNLSAYAGRYYAYVNETRYDNVWIDLGEDGSYSQNIEGHVNSGTYTISGNAITITLTNSGIPLQSLSGTIENGTLTLVAGMGAEAIYRKDGGSGNSGSGGSQSGTTGGTSSGTSSGSASDVADEKDTSAIQGRYYVYENGQRVENDWIELLEDSAFTIQHEDTTLLGTYEVKGNSIILTINNVNATQIPSGSAETVKGTIENGVITISNYVDGKEYSMSYSK